MKSVTLTQALDAAGYALVGERCRQAYLHDIRGGLHALSSAIELLARSAKSPTENGIFLEKAATLAKRAMATHEQAVADLLQRVAPSDEPASRIDLGGTVHQVLHLLRNDAFAKSIVFRPTIAGDVFVSAAPQRCRQLILGLNAAAIDVLDTGSVIDVKLAPVGTQALLEFKCAVRYSGIRNLSDLWASSSTLPAHELMLALISQWVCANGGRTELNPPDLPGALRIHYPMAAPIASI